MNINININIMADTINQQVDSLKTTTVSIFVNRAILKSHRDDNNLILRTKSIPSKFLAKCLFEQFSLQ